MSNLLENMGRQARVAARVVAHADVTVKNAALEGMKAALEKRVPEILAANQQDIEAAKLKGVPEAQLDRLRLTDARLKAMAASILAVRDLPDPVGRLLDSGTRPNGLRIEKRAAPIGVIGIIFEARPNVALDAAMLCLKSGNACILRGGSDSWHSASALIGAIREGIAAAGLPADCVQTPPAPDRDYVGALLTLEAYVDVIIPRGGKSLTQRVKQESRIPVLGHLDGICHTYIDVAADANKAVAIAVNAKMRRTSVCGATECLLLHREIATGTGVMVLKALLASGCDVRVPQALLAFDPQFKPVAESDYGHEFLAAVIAVALVDDAQGAVDFINAHGSQHADAIVTEDAGAARYFLTHVESAIAIHNASTQFADGGEFGKGAEIGIATGRLHARGPVGLEELTVPRYVVFGSGQIRPV